VRKRRLADRTFAWLCAVSAFAGVAILGLFLTGIAREGWDRLSLEFLTGFPSRFPAKAGIKAALWGSAWLVALTALFSIPLGVGAALYLEEFARKSRWTRVIRLNISNLAGVPSIVYGLLGLAVFVRQFGLGRSVLAGAFTMTLLILPTIVTASEEALKAVPDSIRHAAFAVGATRWQMVRDHILPAAMPGILTGVILALSRAIGETAPLIMIGAMAYVPFVPAGPMDAFTVLPIQIFNWTSRPDPAFHEAAAAGILVLLALLLVMNAAAIWLRQRMTRGPRW
jgi:phosphate transport system permease protein